MRKISNNGLRLIMRFEGFSSNIYKDVAGFPTIGYGHLVSPHEFSSFQQAITKNKAEELLSQDIRISEIAVSRLIKSSINQNQFDALVSFTFNLGEAALQRSTLRQKVNRSEHEQVPTEFLRWIYAGNRKVSGLIRRRQAEANLYIS